MKREKTSQGRNKNPGKVRLALCFGFFLFFSGIGLTSNDEWTLLPWGLNLEKLNQAFKEKFKTGEIIEDKYRSEIEFNFAPGKSFKIRRGKVVALLSLTDSSQPGQLYGYAYEGKIFGRAILFKDHPELFPETAIRHLKEQYPQGKVIMNFNANRRTPYFEYKSDQLYVLLTERGVYLYDPGVLEKVVKTEQELFDREEKKIEKKSREDVFIEP